MEENRSEELKLIKLTDNLDHTILNKAFWISITRGGDNNFENEIKDEYLDKFTLKRWKLLNRDLDAKTLKPYSRKSSTLNKSQDLWKTIHQILKVLWKSRIRFPLIRNWKPSPIFYRRFMEWYGSCKKIQYPNQISVNNIELLHFLASVRHKGFLSFYYCNDYSDRGTRKALTSKTLDFKDSHLYELSFDRDLDSIFDTVEYLQQQEGWLKLLIGSPITPNLSTIIFQFTSEIDDCTEQLRILTPMFEDQSKIFPNITGVTCEPHGGYSTEFSVELRILRE